MIRLGINTMVWTGRFDPGRLPLLARLRANVSSALPAGLSITSGDRTIRAKTRAWLERAVECVGALGAAILAGPMYIPVGELTGCRRTGEEWAHAVEEYRALAVAIRGSGVRIAIEQLNRFETYFLKTATDARHFCEEVGDGAIGVLLDTFHANIEEEGHCGRFPLARAAPDSRAPERELRLLDSGDRGRDGDVARVRGLARGIRGARHRAPQAADGAGS